MPLQRIQPCFQQQAALLFEEALRVARERDMRLEVAKVLESYSSLLLHKTAMLEQQRGLDYQREARELLLACQKPEGGIAS